MRGLISSKSYRALIVAASIATQPSLLLAQGGGVGQGSATAPRLPANVEVVVNRLVDSARARRLPTDPLTSKAAEGILKGADSARVVDAVRRLLGDLELARLTLGSCATSAELVAAASVMHAGVTSPQLARIAQDCGERGGGGRVSKPDRLLMPLVVLADLVARRVSADVAVSSLETLLSRSAPDAEFASLRAAIERDIANGTSPDAAMRARSAAVVRTLDARAGGRPPEE
jgi:hypothetical protein